MLLQPFRYPKRAPARKPFIFLKEM